MRPASARSVGSPWRTQWATVGIADTSPMAMRRPSANAASLRRAACRAARTVLEFAGVVISEAMLGADPKAAGPDGSMAVP